MGTPVALYVASEYEALRDAAVNSAGSLVDSTEEDAYLARYGGKIAAERRFHPETAPWQANAVRAQHRDFLDLLEERGVRLHHARDVEGAIYGMFTRDIGFVAGDRFVHARMGDGIRARERAGIEPVLEDIPHAHVLEPARGVVEGGDVLVDGQRIYLGITSHSTDRSGAAAIAALLAPHGFEVVPVRCRENVLHLDCRFNIIAPGTALIHRDDLHPDDVARLAADFTLLDVPAQEVPQLATNILALNPDEAVVDARNEGTARTLRREGIEPLPVRYDEATKLWGAFRCATLPLARGAPVSMHADGN